MKNKKLLIAGASAASLAALGLGAFAFFTDTVELTKNTQVGTVDITASAEIKHTQLKREAVLSYPYVWNGFDVPVTEDWSYVGPKFTIDRIALTQDDVKDMFKTAPDNLNPGDNMIADDQSVYPGTDHDIVINITNEGSKSVRTRVLFEITGTDNDGNPLTKQELENIRVFLDPYNTVSGLTSASSSRYITDNIFLDRQALSQLTDIGADDNDYKVVYGIDGGFWIPQDISTTRFGEVFTEGMSEIVLSDLSLSGNPKHDNYETESYFHEYYEEIIDEDGDSTFEANWTTEDTPYSGSLKFDIGMYSVEDFKDYWSGAINQNALAVLQRLQEADIEIKVIVQAMQLRNSTDYLWDTVFTQSFYS